MKYQKQIIYGVIGALSMGVEAVNAAEILVNQSQNTDMVVSVYNNNLGLVHDTRRVKLQKGRNDVAFEGVSKQIRAESAILTGKGINVREQNYDYNLLTSQNLLDSYVGKEVKTAIQNPIDGSTMYDKATVLSNINGRPVLQFGYGVDADFPGRIIYDKVPENLRKKPTLVAALESQKSGEEALELTYLTGGLSWKADYVAEITDADKLDINTWITLSNETGSDYDNATIQLISGSVNHFSDAGGAIRPAVMMSKAMVMENGMGDSFAPASSVAPESVSDYYMYVLPEKTDIKDKQSKQISLMNLQNVKYEKEYRFVSPLYLGIGAAQNEFEKRHPSIVFQLTNEKQNNLGQPLPSGMMRFYENKNGNMVFLGESSISQTAVGEKAELNLGQAFDVYASGKIAESQQISKGTWQYRVKISFKNVSAQKSQISFEQKIYGKWKIIKDNMDAQSKNASAAQWKFTLQPQETKELDFTIRIEL